MSANISITELKYANESETLIDMNVTQDGKTFPFTYDPADNSKIAVAVRALLRDDNPAKAPFEAPPARVPRTISDRQFFQQLAVAKVITEEEAIAAVAIGKIPSAMQAIIDTLAAPDQFAATMLLAGATQFNRDHPLVAAFAAGMSWTSEQVDALWTSANTL